MTQGRSRRLERLPNRWEDELEGLPSGNTLVRTKEINKVLHEAGMIDLWWDADIGTDIDAGYRLMLLMLQNDRRENHEGFPELYPYFWDGDEDLLPELDERLGYDTISPGDVEDKWIDDPDPEYHLYDDLLGRYDD